MPETIMRMATVRAGEEFFGGVRNVRDWIGRIKGRELIRDEK
jgi:hypothetical protein